MDASAWIKLGLALVNGVMAFADVMGDKIDAEGVRARALLYITSHTAELATARNKDQLAFDNADAKPVG